jgi:putative transposase
MMYPLVIELDAEGIPVRTTCRVLGFSPQAFYKWKARPYSDRDWDDAHLVNAIIDIHADDPAFGYRFITDELHRDGWSVSQNRVQRLCQEHQIWSVFAKKPGRSRKTGPPVHDDLLNRDFTADGPDERWVGDITEHPTLEGKLYVATFKDLWSNRIVGYALGPTMPAELAVRALRNAARGRDTRGTIVHTDRGSQYRANLFVAELKILGMVGSMGRVGACGDNASAESFFALLQKNVLNSRPVWANRAELEYAIVAWIERTYHRRRKQRSLGRLTPIEYETIYTPAATKAA